MKPCSTCKETKPLAEFYFRRGRQTHVARCKQCSNEYAAKWRQRNPNRYEKYKDKHRLRIYGLTAEGLERLRAEQGDSCAICKTKFGRRVKPHVDHWHGCCPTAGRSCGRCVRGLLCLRCNLIVGLIETVETGTEAHRAYIDRYRGEIRQRPQLPVGPPRVHSEEVRRWAIESGYKVSNRGAVPRAVVHAYVAAHPDAVLAVGQPWREANGPSWAKIRSWAREKGYPLAQQGPLAKQVVRDYAAQGEAEANEVKELVSRHRGKWVLAA